jgi:nitrate reductase gamma subunit
MNAYDLLIWARGTGFNLALAVFILGMLLRLFEVLSLGHKPDLAEGRGSATKGGLRTLWTRNFPRKTVFAKAPLRIINGYVMHIGLFVVIFMYGPHIALIESTLGFDWPGLPSGVIDAMTAITLLSLGSALAIRLMHPVMRFLSDAGDYVAWVVTLLPVLTGYLTYNHLFFPYTLMLALHILSVELLLVVAPFSKLTHMFSFIPARWFQGAEAGYRGTES